MKSWLKYLIIAPIILIAILVLLYSMRYNYENKEIENTIYEVMEYMCGADTQINKFAAGDVLFDLSNIDNGHKIKLKDTKVKIENKQENLADAICRIELILSDNTIDVCWYRVKLVNKECWRIYDINEQKPILFNEGRFSGDTKELEKVFSTFIKKYKEDKDYTIKNYSAGLVRRNLELYGEQEELINNDLEDLSFNYVCGDSKLVVVDANYSINKAKVSNLITFYNTNEGWKIVDIKSSLIK